MIHEHEENGTNLNSGNQAHAFFFRVNELVGPKAKQTNNEQTVVWNLGAM